MSDKKKAEVKKEVKEEVEEDAKVFELEVDTNNMTLDDLEMLSLHDDGHKVADWRLIQFLKRVVIGEIGDTLITEIEPMVEAIFDKIILIL